MYGLLFDLDGVLIDSKTSHFDALNLALEDIDAKYRITEEEQLLTYEGLTTRSKLEILHRVKGLPEALFETIWLAKQHYTFLLFSNLKPDPGLVSIFKGAKDRGFLVSVVSNSIRETLDMCLSRLGLVDYVDLSVSNEDSKKPKPDPEPYLLAMRRLDLSPGNCAIFEDSAVGRLAAIASGAMLVPIENRDDLTQDKVLSACQTLRKSTDLT